MHRENNVSSKTIDHARRQLFEKLDELGIIHETREHRAVFKVEEGRDLKATMPGGHSKNLFMKDKKGKFFLAVAHADTKVDLVALGKVAGSKGRLSFGKPDAMNDILGVSPGSVTPFAMINDQDHKIGMMVLDRALMAFDKIWFHPLINTASTSISSEGLVRFLKACGAKPVITDLTNPRPEDFAGFADIAV